MDPAQGILLLAIFLTGALVLLYDLREGTLNSVFRIINRSIVAPWDLNTFLHLESEPPEPNQYYSFAEEAVVSMGHRYSGRFDQAILRFDGVPVLEVVIERKFPSRNMPRIVRPEDMFQAGLYALALMEKGVSCSSTRLVVIYCTQKDASSCVSADKGVNCFGCRKGRAFQQEFNMKKVLKTLKRLDEIWYKRRKPKPSPEVGKCRACPYGTNGVCNHSAA
jgi:CRISPR/Cas system-associated exonuclease Cas4 (RecB family)